jgi:hypothetical protein
MEVQVYTCFRALVAGQFQVVANAKGLADLPRLTHHQRARLERVAIQRALEECHILTIEGRDYRR